MCDKRRSHSYDGSELMVEINVNPALPRWRKRATAPTLYGMPQPGDLIEIFRGTYQHWGLYIGEGDIVHLAPPCETPGAGPNCLMSVLYDKAIVMRERLGQVVGQDRFHVNNLLDSKHKPRSVCVILRDALSLAGLEMPYCVLRGNCEHFVTELRYGRAESRQIHYAVKIGVRSMAIGMKALKNASSLSRKQEKEKSLKISPTW
ncbi:phospholipase A and acyltransferase 4-like [Salminus brasiliensis]|uniref:phospholipase A and acyltransferase 4-like n=1 Tax=Salminus brasiliensis TaxID=930266 RepID=UPI003B838E77